MGGSAWPRRSRRVLHRADGRSIGKLFPDGRCRRSPKTITYQIHSLCISPFQNDDRRYNVHQSLESTAARDDSWAFQLPENRPRTFDFPAVWQIHPPLPDDSWSTLVAIGLTVVHLHDIVTGLFLPRIDGDTGWNIPQDVECWSVRVAIVPADLFSHQFSAAVELAEANARRSVHQLGPQRLVLLGGWSTRDCRLRVLAQLAAARSRDDTRYALFRVCSVTRWPDVMPRFYSTFATPRGALAKRAISGAGVLSSAMGPRRAVEEEHAFSGFRWARWTDLQTISAGTTHFSSSRPQRRSLVERSDSMKIFIVHDEAWIFSLRRKRIRVRKSILSK